MKFNFNLNTHFIENLIADLREKRLWPIAAALVVALVAVPVLLSSGGSSSVPVAAAPPVPAPSGAVPALPAVSVTATPSHARLTGKQRDPFKQQVKSKSTTAKTATSKTSSTSKSSSGSTSTTKKSAASTTSGAVGGSTTTVTSTPTTSTPTTPTPAPTGLTASQAYHVAISMTVATGDVQAVDPVERLSLLPSNQEPRLIELGVQNGGHRVLFVVQPGTIVRGPGRCTPGPIDCEIISLAPNQIEWVGTSGPSGIATVALMAVTAINAADYSSPAAADKARTATSKNGRRALSDSTSRALSLFQFKPGLGALVDLSNVTVGGN